jgi:hypothetical protein
VIPVVPALLAAAATAGCLSAQQATLATLQLGEPFVLRSVSEADCDGDGRPDLVLLAVDPTMHRRELRLHRRTDAVPCFTTAASRPPYVLERDVLGFCFADVDAQPGKDLVLFTASRAVLARQRDDGAVEYTPLFEHAMLWIAPDADSALPLNRLVRDVDGDGRDDFVLPEHEGVRIVRQLEPPDPTAEPRFAAPVVLRLPDYKAPVESAGAGPARLRGNSLELSFSLGGADDARDRRERGPLLAVATRSAPWHFVDFDGDGTNDGLALRNDKLWRWRPGTDTAEELPLPLPPDRLTLVDPMFDVQLHDLDGDGKSDLVLTTSGRRNDEIEVRIDTFRQRADGSLWPERADGRLRTMTLARAPQLLDADGDGRLDLIAVTVRTDVLRQATGRSDLEAQINVFRGDGGRFAVPAIANERVSLPVGRDADTFIEAVPAAGDAPPAIVLRSGDRLLLRPLVRDGERLRVAPPSVTVPIPSKCTLRLARHEPRTVLVRGERELLHVRLP